jgi:4-amino-4-deoxy-L-arabinose transferase-like glycosyltransferase
MVMEAHATATHAMAPARWWQRLWRRAQPHLLPLVALLAASNIAQIATLTQVHAITQTADTPGYLHVAQGIMGRGMLFDPVRTPGYPALLALVFAIAGKQNLNAVVGVQTALLVGATLELYPLAYLLLRRRWLAAGCAGMVALNLYFVNWERAITSEALALWLVITYSVCLARALHTRHWAWWLALGLLGAVLVLTRPFFIYLPGVVGAVVLAQIWHGGQLRRHWWHAALVLGVAYSLILAYMIGNAAVDGYFGLSDVGSVNLFGKVLEYDMQNETTDPHTAQLRADLRRYLAISHEPWGFPYHYPAYARDQYQPLADFSHEIILGHPVEYGMKTLPDVLATLNAYPTAYAPFAAPLPPWMVTLLNLSYAELGFAILFPLMLGARIWAWWRAPQSARRTLSLVLALGVAGTILMAAAGAYTVTSGTSVAGDFYRLRAPMDWALILLLSQSVLEMGCR